MLAPWTAALLTPLCVAQLCAPGPASALPPSRQEVASQAQAVKLQEKSQAKEQVAKAKTQAVTAPKQATETQAREATRKAAASATAEKASREELWRAMSLTRKGDVQAAEALYRQLLSEGDSQARFDAQLGLATALAETHDSGKVREAETMLRTAATATDATTAQRAKASNAYGVFLLQQGRARDASSALARGVETARQADAGPGALARMHYNLGVALERSARSREALAAYRQALQLQPKLDAARDAAERLIARLPPAQRAENTTSLVRMLIESSDLASAERYLRSALRAATDGARPSVLPAELPSLLARLLARDPTSPSEFEERWQGDLERGIEALDLSSETRGRLQLISRIYLGDLPLVLDPCEARRLTRPWQVRAQEPALALCSGSGRPLDTRLEADFSALLRSVASQLERGGALDGAVRRWALDWSAADSYDSAAYLIGSLLHSGRHIEAADQLLESVVSSIFELKATAYRSADWKSILRFHALLGEIFQEQGRWGDRDDPRTAIFQWEHALEAQRRLADDQPLPSVRSNLAYCYQKSGNRSAAADQYIQAAEEYVAIGRPAQATTQLERVKTLGDLSPQRSESLRALERTLEQQRAVRDASIPSDDRLLARELQSRLSAEPTLQRGAVEVQVDDGQVTLTGAVPDAAIEDVRRLVQSAAGVKGVAIQEASPPP